MKQHGASQLSQAKKLQRVKRWATSTVCCADCCLSIWPTYSIPCALLHAPYGACSTKHLQEQNHVIYLRERSSLESLSHFRWLVQKRRPARNPPLATVGLCDLLGNPTFPLSRARPEQPGTWQPWGHVRTSINKQHSWRCWCMLMFLVENVSSGNNLCRQSWKQQQRYGRDDLSSWSLSASLKL